MRYAAAGSQVTSVEDLKLEMKCVRCAEVSLCQCEKLLHASGDEILVQALVNPHLSSNCHFLLRPIKFDCCSIRESEANSSSIR